MILIADSGSTKTDWILFNTGAEKINFSTQGLNPYFINSVEIQTELRNVFTDFALNNGVKKIFFYGAGCSSDPMKKVVFDGLQPVFKNADITIKSDLLGATRALFFNEPGIAVILGTGSNTCLYDGNTVAKTIRSLGYIFGDEGGGTHIGKLFISYFLSNKLSDELKNKFINRYNLTKDQILQKVYSEPFPNSFLASFCSFINENSSFAEIEDILNHSFSELFRNYICKYPDYRNYKIRVAGSIGQIFEKQLRKTASQFKTDIDLILQRPITKLVEFHTNNN